MECVGFQLFYERDWECCVALIPSADENIPKMGGQVIRTISLETFQTLKSNFRKNVNEYVVNHIAIRTLMKIDVNSQRMREVAGGGGAYLWAVEVGGGRVLRHRRRTKSDIC